MSASLLLFLSLPVIESVEVILKPGMIDLLNMSSKEYVDRIPLNSSLLSKFFPWKVVPEELIFSQTRVQLSDAASA